MSQNMYVVKANGQEFQAASEEAANMLAAALDGVVEIVTKSEALSFVRQATKVDPIPAKWAETLALLKDSIRIACHEDDTEDVWKLTVVYDVKYNAFGVNVRNYDASGKVENEDSGEVFRSWADVAHRAGKAHTSQYPHTAARFYPSATRDRGYDKFSKVK